ncbi:hypothetical protein CYY_004683 [Polysphondylium violaceum]|uniref:cathepsin X n=1 Tax=Polysphondylium violaceum TaxID=133409 RepID=A0A8J4PW37_9MYCE|nr:hypothetical protein CYY_004683 [Polysphondylium violaceum]
MYRLTLAILFLVAVTGSFAHESCVRRIADPLSHTNVKSPVPSEYLSVGDLPTSWDWRNVSGRSYVTITRNQHLPQYCGACWSFATTSALSDRIKMVQEFPEVNLAPQVLLNCLSGSSCDGGDPTSAYEYIFAKGIPDETCAPYEAIDLECTPENICKNCAFDLDNPEAKCVAQPTYNTYFVEEHGLVNGSDAMMAEIYARGPIACGMEVTSAFEAYTGGIFSDSTGATGQINHEISVIGWGSENGVDYWTVRNSWGTYFGELGFFRIQRGLNLLSIESDCDWAVPKGYPYSRN